MVKFGVLNCQVFLAKFHTDHCIMSPVTSQKPEIDTIFKFMESITRIRWPIIGENNLASDSARVVFSSEPNVTVIGAETPNLTSF